MNHIELCERLRNATYLVKLVAGDETKGHGSAVCINSDGHLLTAAHVIREEFPPDTEEAPGPEHIILGRTTSEGYQRYRPISAGISVFFPSLLKPLWIDIAMLEPLQPQLADSFMPLSLEAPAVGTEVLMAGFPDDVGLPLDFDQYLDYSVPQIRKQRQALSEARRLLFIRSGMIGLRSELNISDPEKGLRITGDVIYIDNVLHSGGSGGPIVNSRGEVIGIVTERAFTPVPLDVMPELKIPSGTAVGVTARTLFTKPLVQEQG